MLGFALSLRAEIAQDGVDVSVVYPGPIRDAGMWAESGLSLPAGGGTKSPAQVGAVVVVAAIERNRAELNVAPWPMRIGALVARVAPGPFVLLGASARGRRLTSALAQATRHKR
jgi:short-subunit dehydrogenase